MIAALLGWAVLSERISRRTWLAMVMAAVGVAAMVAGSFDAGALAVVAADRDDVLVRRS